jgi:hypothetical protein
VGRRRTLRASVDACRSQQRPEGQSGARGAVIQHSRAVEPSRRLNRGDLRQTAPPQLCLKKCVDLVDGRARGAEASPIRRNLATAGADAGTSRKQAGKPTSFDCFRATE